MLARRNALDHTIKTRFHRPFIMRAFLRAPSRKCPGVFDRATLPCKPSSSKVCTMQITQRHGIASNHRSVQTSVPGADFSDTQELQHGSVGSGPLRDGRRRSSWTSGSLCGAGAAPGPPGRRTPPPDDSAVMRPDRDDRGALLARFEVDGRPGVLGGAHGGPPYRKGERAVCIIGVRPPVPSPPPPRAACPIVRSLRLRAPIPGRIGILSIRGMSSGRARSVDSMRPGRG